MLYKDRLIAMKVIILCDVMNFSRKTAAFENDESLESGRAQFGACLKIYLLVLLKAAM